ncbi:MAG TPA: sensor histidine kinase [Gemmatimonadaceae bacterium]|nr:sensor histidine kinase [Gemmatimonadaceae bacterium]
MAPLSPLPPAPPAHQDAPRLSSFIRDNLEPILAEWETFARSLPGGGEMNVAALRDHARDMLLVIADDLERPQSDSTQGEKARGERDADNLRSATAAQEHGAGRADSGFTVGQMVAEFRALRASVTRLWLAEDAGGARTDLKDLIRFNEAIDQAIAESVSRFSQSVGQTQERFLAILSHDLRSPLGAIIMATRFMLDAGGLEEPNRTLVTRASSSARRMNRMVLDLVEFTRTRLDDTIPVVRSAVDGVRLVHDVVVEIAAAYPDSVVQVETSGDLSGLWDADRLTQALTNLVANAVQHGARGKPIRVTAHGEADEVTLSVHNEGPPIPEEQQAAIFQEGHRVGVPTSTPDRRHQGLGLYIVERIVASHGGNVSVRSSAEEGTTFTIHLPRKP